jgi:hypothetical protein
MVIVDEAHTCAYGYDNRGGRHQRYQLMSQLATHPERHVILVTATPHSGNEAAFRSLLGMLHADFANLPEDLSGRENEPHRRRLAAHFVQRRRADIRRYLDIDTVFPERQEAEDTYRLSPDYKRLFERVLNYARETVRDTGGTLHRQRVRWWSALALLRSLASSPAAAVATLRTRAASADTETAEEADAVGRQTVLDLQADEMVESLDLTPGSDLGDASDEERRTRRRLLDMAREAEKLLGARDEKLKKAISLIDAFIRNGFNPIVFCRFIPTAEYVAEELRKKLRDVEVAAVTGTLPPDEREERVAQLAQAEKRVLVCTDCLSEGINLQEHFDAVMHYDLSWNPTRHEQREGRVDRYGQPSRTVRVLTFYGIDNQIDGIVLDVLIRKHKAIRNSLGISVPVPVDTNQVVEAIFEGLLLRGPSGTSAEQMLLFEEFFTPQREDLYSKWDAVTEREKRSRTMFAQEAIKVDDVARELQAVRAAIGFGLNVEAFTMDALRAYGAAITSNGTLRADLTETPRALREAMRTDENTFIARFDLPVKDSELYLSRTHPLVEGLATYVMDTALDPLGQGLARRCGVVRTSRVARRTTLLLVRLRYHIITRHGEQEKPLLAEDCQVLAFAGAPQNAEWLYSDTAEALLDATPDANITPEQAADFVRRVIDGFATLQPYLDQAAIKRGEALLEAHRRVRTASQLKGISYRVEAQLPPDVLGIYVYLPKV